MEYRKLGNTGLEISALSFGSWLTFGKSLDTDQASSLMTLAYDAGVDFFDNAEIYANGRSEEIMGEVLKRKRWPRSSWMVSGKVFFGFEDKRPNQRGLSRKHIMEGCEASLRRLQVEYIDILFCHRPDKNTPIAETVAAMDTLIRQGKVLYWGTSEWSAAEIMQARLEAVRHHMAAPVVEQPQYNLFTREKMEMDYEHLFRYDGLGTTVWSPLSSGLLTGKYTAIDAHGHDRFNMAGLEWLRNRNLTEEKLAKVKQLKMVADGLGISMAVMSIAWCLKNPHVSTVILGATREEQLAENLEAINAGNLLTPEVLNYLDEIMGNKPILPEH